MPTRLVHLVWDANDPAALARFWATALGWVIADEDEDEVDVWPEGYSYPDPAAVPLVFVPVPEPKTGKNRVHLDLASNSLPHQASLVARLRDLGASPVDIGQGEVPWVILADPEGNEFCVLEPRDSLPGHRPGGSHPDRLRRPGCARPVLDRGGRLPGRLCRGPHHRPARPVRSQVPYLEFLRVPDAKTVKNRLHPDVAPYPGDDPAAEVARLRGLGAVPADIGQGDVNWTVLADPEGNEFCVLSPR